MKQLIAEDLLKIKAVFLRPNEPFTWASGIKSPIYCDNRLTLSDTQVRNDVENGLAQLIKEFYRTRGAVLTVPKVHSKTLRTFRTARPASA